jgi:6-phosphogluconolactonase (cycloisomerase 2 family)
MNKHALGSMIAVLAAAITVCCGANGRAATAAGPFVYVANTKSNEISQYSGASSTPGALTPLTPATVPTGPFAYGIAVDPQGDSLYTADVGPSNAPATTVSQFTINPVSGRLTPKSPATVTAGRGPVEIAVTPNGKSAYVVGETGISQFNVNPTTGALTRKVPGLLAAGRNPEPIAIAPNGKYAYVANCPGCETKLRGSHSARPSKPQTATIREYRIKQTTGRLSAIGSVATGTGANGIAITPNGTSLYVAVGPIWQYSVNPTTGKLTPKSPATIPAAGTAHELQVAPDGRNLYVVTVANNTVSQYRINPTTGALSSKPASTARTVLHPESIKLAPNGTSAYVTSENDPEISQYAINPTTGRITPMMPATVPTASGSLGLAITPGP